MQGQGTPCLHTLYNICRVADKACLRTGDKAGLRVEDKACLVSTSYYPRYLRLFPYICTHARKSTDKSNSFSLNL